MRIKAYTWRADVHCVECTREASLWKNNARELVSPSEHSAGLDENKLAYDLTDREGNKISPIFTADENDSTHCGKCHKEL